MAGDSVTVILGAVDNTTMYMGSDSQVTYGNSKGVVKDLKVFKKGDMLFGVCGSPRIIQLLHYSLNLPEQPKNFPDYAYMGSYFIDAVRECLKVGGYSKIDNNIETGGDFLVAYHGVIYDIDSNFSVTHFEKEVAAIGSGDETAIGAFCAFRKMGLGIKESLKKSIEITCDINLYCSLPVSLKTLAYKK